MSPLRSLTLYTRQTTNLPPSLEAPAMTAKERTRLSDIYARWVSGEITAVRAEREAGMYISQMCSLLQDQNDGGTF